MLRRVAYVAAVVVALLAPTGTALAADKVPINGAGSTWSKPALAAWTKDVAQFGLEVGYADTGSTDGRKQFANGKVEFGVSEIPYGLPDSATRDIDSPPTGRGYAYMPIVAGGTSFMYNLMIGGQRVTNLRLSGDTVTKIFTNVITFWDDPAIKADNPKLALPKLKIVPVVRSDGSGTSAQFTLWMSKTHPDLWNAFCRANGRNVSPCGLTSYYPVVSGKNIGQSGSDGVAGYVIQPQYQGAITYVEYSYAKSNHFPVVKLLNDGGYYTEPTEYSVAVAMAEAKINADLTQNLDGVYTAKDIRAYPLSSYSYMILPTDTRMGFTEDKGFTLATFAYYFLCQGQEGARKIGFSPLPKNLVEAAVQQVQKIPGSAAATWDITHCGNPTFGPGGTNALATKAQQPPACDSVAAKDQCASGTGGAPAQTRLSGTGTGTPAGAAGTGGASAPPPGGAAVVDPDTGETLSAGGAGGGGGGSGGGAGSGDVAGVPVSLAQNGTWGLRRALMVLAGGLLLCLILGPPLLGRALGRTGPGARRGRDGGER